MLIGLVGEKGTGKSTIADILHNMHGFQELAFAEPIKMIAQDLFKFSDEQLFGPSETREVIDWRYSLNTGTWYTKAWNWLTKCIYSEEDVREYWRDVLQRLTSPNEVRLSDLSYLKEPLLELRRGCLGLGMTLTPRDILICIGQAAREKDPEYWVKQIMNVVKYLGPTNDLVISDVRQYNEAQAIEAAGGILWRVVSANPPEISDVDPRVGWHESIYNTKKQGIGSLRASVEVLLSNSRYPRINTNVLGVNNVD